MRRSDRLLPSVLATFIAFAGLVDGRPAWAGCGCDHPPPDWAVVMPAFASPDKVVTIFADQASYAIGEVYVVDFEGVTVPVTAALDDRIEVAMPDGVELGPVAIRVTGPGYDFTYPQDAFTALPHPREIIEEAGIFNALGYEAAVGADGTIYLPLDVGSVKDAMQFSFAFLNLPLEFAEQDVAIYNADGFDLSLFTLEVADGTERQWGSYFGWSVTEDSDLQGDWFLPKTKKPDDLATKSDVFSYWRHEFYTYHGAHQVGGSHEVNEHDFHPDGTLHVDHYQLVIAISGLERDPEHADDPTHSTPLSPGSQGIDVSWVSVRADNPVEPDDVISLLWQAYHPDTKKLNPKRFRKYFGDGN